MANIHKRIDIADLDIPTSDIECWNRYPKYRWVYDLSRLLESQNIEWCPFVNTELTHKEVINSLQDEPGYIYIKEETNEFIPVEVYIIKGEIKLIRQINSEYTSGQIEIRLNAFITLYFQKFTGVISVNMSANQISRIYLKPFTDINNESNQEVVKLLKRIYKKII